MICTDSLCRTHLRSLLRFLFLFFSSLQIKTTKQKQRKQNTKPEIAAASTESHTHMKKLLFHHSFTAKSKPKFALSRSVSYFLLHFAFLSSGIRVLEIVGALKEPWRIRVKSKKGCGELTVEVAVG
ncbi:hypothetical protein AKJ16_DCAP10037 [Drosera capensis]